MRIFDIDLPRLLIHIIYEFHGYGGPEQFDAKVIKGTDSCAALVAQILA
jgi:hypothetical protein